MRTHGTGRFFAGIAALILLAAVLFSAFFLALEADHDCAGDDCPICACILLCEKTLRVVGGGFAARSGAVLPILPLLSAAVFCAAMLTRETRVSSKLWLNN